VISDWRFEISEIQGFEVRLQTARYEVLSQKLLILMRLQIFQKSEEIVPRPNTSGSGSGKSAG
jgi:hypothetical protein